MAWTTTLTTFSDGGTPTAAQLNPYFDNIEWLHSPPNAKFESGSASDYTTTSTNWGTIEANFSTTLVTYGENVFALFEGVINLLELDMYVDGSRFNGTGTAGTGSIRDDNSVIDALVNMPVLFDSLAAGTHTFAMGWKATSATGSLRAAYRPRFFVRAL